MNKKKTYAPYLHGFDKSEQQRLIDTAKFSEHSLYQGVDFSENNHVIEIGCGVGAQTEILLRRFPNLKLTSIDLRDEQLNVAKTYLKENSFKKNRYQLLKMNAEEISFKDETFDGAFLCWILEHVSNPQKVLLEANRLMLPKSKIYITEVMNSSFFLEPYSSHVWSYWMKFNDFQYDHAGDPFIGAKLGNLLLDCGFTDIETKVISWHFDKRHPKLRAKALSIWSYLLLSAAPHLLKHKYVTNDEVKKCQAELKSLASNPNAVFFYSFIQAQARS
ncbi:MAG: class I SAM-dependent methyltransferase [Bacteriovoracaceae bacterium]|nr:class I SAM-dependent methyltransferase [Bacteriovoracaceae bacterium]